jgi:hypothetical protein
MGQRERGKSQFGTVREREERDTYEVCGRIAGTVGKGVGWEW